MVDLKKPFAVLEKHSVCLDAADPMDADGEATDQHNVTEYKVDILWLVGRAACLNHSCEDSISIPFCSTLALNCVCGRSLAWCARSAYLRTAREPSFQSQRQQHENSGALPPNNFFSFHCFAEHAHSYPRYLLYMRPVTMHKLQQKESL